MALIGNEIVFVSGVSPTGGLSSVPEPVTTQQIAALASQNPGGVASLISLNVSANQQFDGKPVPANTFLLRLLLRNLTATPVNVSLGTALNASDVGPNVGATPWTVPANGTLTADIGGFLKGWFSAASPQALFLASASWGGAIINAQLDYEVGP